MTQKKITRKQLLKEPDEFLTVSGRMLEFASRHKKQVLAVFASLMFLVVISAGIRFYQQQATRKASVLLSEIQTTYREKAETSQEDALAAVEEALTILLEKYASRPAGKMGRVISADWRYQAGDYAKAIEMYQEALGDFGDPLVINRIQRGLAYAYLAKGDLSVAASHFAQIVSAPQSLAKDEALFLLGQIYAELEQLDKSREAFRQLTTDHGESMYAPLVEDKLG